MSGASCGMRFQLPPLQPVVRLVVVPDEAQHQARGALVNDQADVAAHAHGPEVLVLRLVEPVKAHAGVGWIDLQVERRRLDRLLLVAGEPAEAVGEGVGDPELGHR